MAPRGLSLPPPPSFPDLCGQSPHLMQRAPLGGSWGFRWGRPFCGLLSTTAHLGRSENQEGQVSLTWAGWGPAQPALDVSKTYLPTAMRRGYDSKPFSVHIHNAEKEKPSSIYQNICIIYKNGTLTSHCYWRQWDLTMLAAEADGCVPPAHRQNVELSGMWADSFVRSQKPGHFGTQQSDEGSWKHLPGLLGCVLEIVLGMGQDIKQCLDQLLILKWTEILLLGQNI